MQEFFDKLEAKAKGVIKAANNALDQKPPVYSAVDQLITQIDLLLKDKKLSKTETEKDALAELKALKSDLKDAKIKFDEETKDFYKNGISPFVYKQAIEDFSQRCNDAIHDHQPKIMAAPGIWNKLKAYINNFMEKHFDVKNYFEVKGTEVSHSKDFKSKFEQVKEETRENTNESDSSLKI